MKKLRPNQAFKSQTRDFSLYNHNPENINHQENSDISIDIQNKYTYLKERYGDRYHAVLPYIVNTHERQIDGIPYLEGEIYYMSHNEFVTSTWDILRRRTKLVLEGQTTASSVDKIRAILAQEKGWSTDKIKKDIEITKEKMSKFKLE